VVKLAGAPMPGVPKEQRQKALQMVVENSTSDATKKQARELLEATP